MKWFGLVVAVLVLGALTTSTGRRLADWESDETLWRSAVRVNPDNPRAVLNLSASVIQTRPSEGLRLAEEAWRLAEGRPEEAAIRRLSAVNSAIALIKLGDKREAQRRLWQVLMERPGYAPAEAVLQLLPWEDITGR